MPPLIQRFEDDLRIVTFFQHDLNNFQFLDERLPYCVKPLFPEAPFSFIGSFKVFVKMEEVRQVPLQIVGFYCVLNSVVENHRPL